MINLKERTSDNKGDVRSENWYKVVVSVAQSRVHIKENFDFIFFKCY
jgi:hypothetical protein